MKNDLSILNKAATAAHTVILKQTEGAQSYSQYPVHESAFWEAIFTAAKDPKKARKVLKELEHIEAEPCIENERVFHNVRNARSMARMALLN